MTVVDRFDDSNMILVGVVVVFVIVDDSVSKRGMHRYSSEFNSSRQDRHCISVKSSLIQTRGNLDD